MVAAGSRQAWREPGCCQALQAHGARKTGDRANQERTRPNSGHERAAWSTLHLLLRLASLGLLGFSVVGQASSAMRMNRKAWMLLAIVFYFLFLSGGPVGYHRFRLP